MKEVLVSVKNLKKYFPIKKGLLRKTVGYVKAVDDLSLDIYKGETLGIVGESGCGKSTMGRTVIRLVDRTEGRIVFNRQDISDLKGERLRAVKKDMQMVFQDPYGSLNPRFKVREIIAEPLLAHGTVQKSELESVVKKLMGDVGLSKDYINRFPHEFSGGQRQRISIARALALNPQFIVCDEAVSALDVSTQSQILNLLKDLQKKYELTYLFISHNLSVVNFISDRVGVMYLGKLVELAEVDKLYNHFAHPYTKALLSAIPEPDPQIKKERMILSGDVPSPANPPSGCRFHPRCPQCREICTQQQPELKDIGDKHFVACHFPLVEFSEE